MTVQTSPRARTPRFHYSSYWRTWSLLLTRRHIVGMRGQTWRDRPVDPARDGYTVEVNLTPVNGWEQCGQAEIERLRGIVIRTHCTANSGRDEDVDVLPDHVVEGVRTHLGADIADWLLDPATEILGIVDWDAHRRLDNGGAMLRECVKPQFADRIPAAPRPLPLAA